MLRLTRKKVKFEWGDNKIALFNCLEDKSYAVHQFLALPEEAKISSHHCDDSKKGFGRCIDAERKKNVPGRRMVTYTWNTSFNHLCCDTRFASLISGGNFRTLWVLMWLDVIAYIHITQYGQSERTIQNFEDMLRAFAKSIWKRPQPFEVLSWSKVSFTCLLGLKLEEAQILGPENNSRDTLRRESSRSKAKDAISRSCSTDEFR
ncbi:hypothetical protein Tco_0155810 [Tanacetum coccineum]